MAWCYPEEIGRRSDSIFLVQDNALTRSIHVLSKTKYTEIENKQTLNEDN